MSRRRARRTHRVGDHVWSRRTSRWGGVDHQYWDRGEVAAVRDDSVQVVSALNSRHVRWVPVADVRASWAEVRKTTAPWSGY